MEQELANILEVEEGKLPEWCPKDLSGRHLVMCEYHLAGFSHRDIGAVLGYHEGYVGQVLRGAPARKYIASRVQDLNDELHGQFKKVVQNMSEALSHEDLDMRLKATEMWFKAHGRFAPKAKNEDGPVSAEEVVQRILENAKNVQVNIDNRRYDGPPPRVDDHFFMEDDK